MLIGEKTEEQLLARHSGPQSFGVTAAFEEQSARAAAQIQEQAVQSGLLQGAIGGGKLKLREEMTRARINLEVSEMPDGHDAANWSRGGSKVGSSSALMLAP